MPDPEKYNANYNFSVFVLVEPDVTGAQKVPLLYYEWSWRLNAIFEGGSWHEVEGSHYPNRFIEKSSVTETPLSTLTNIYPFGFPKWDKVLGDKFPWKEK